MIRWARTGTLGLLALGLVVAGAQASCKSGTEPGEVVEIHLTSDLTFSPGEVTIAPGTRVRWVNDANIFHTITPDGHDEWTRATVSEAGDEFSHTFDAEGTFPYYCEPHLSQGMTGSIVVQSP